MGQGVTLVSQALIAGESRNGALLSRFGPDLAGAPPHMVYPAARRNDPLVRAVRDPVMGLAAEVTPPAIPRLSSP